MPGDHGAAPPECACRARLVRVVRYGRHAVGSVSAGGAPRDGGVEDPSPPCGIAHHRRAHGRRGARPVRGGDPRAGGDLDVAAARSLADGVAARRRAPGARGRMRCAPGYPPWKSIPRKEYVPPRYADALTTISRPDAHGVTRMRCLGFSAAPSDERGSRWSTCRSWSSGPGSTVSRPPSASPTRASPSSCSSGGPTPRPSTTPGRRARCSCARPPRGSCRASACSRRSGRGRWNCSATATSTRRAASRCARSRSATSPGPASATPA